FPVPSLLTRPVNSTEEEEEEEEEEPLLSSKALNNGKAGATREKALSLMLDRFTNNVQHRFIKNECITLLHRCLNSMKHGSSKEICLASNVIGLLAITVGPADGLAHEILEDSIPTLSQALQSASELSQVASLLDCLAIVTLVGGNNVEETERSMQVMWQFIHPKEGSDVVASAPASAAISAWSFLLATMHSWSINSKLWKESLSYFSNLLYMDDLSIQMAVGEALALIFEIGNLPKFSNETKMLTGTSVHEESEGNASIEGLKDTILKQVRTLSVQIEGSDSTEKGLIKRQKTLFQDVLKVLKGSCSPETTIQIGRGLLKISTWSQLVQLNFLKRFLGVGFLKHAQENELLRDLFEFTPKRNQQLQGGKQHIGCEEKVAIHLYQRPEVRMGSDLTLKKLNSSDLNKAKTQLMNKKRMLSQKLTRQFSDVVICRRGMMVTMQSHTYKLRKETRSDLENSSSPADMVAPEAPPLQELKLARHRLKNSEVDRPSRRGYKYVPTATRDMWERLFDEGYRADVSITTSDGSVIHAHASILGMASPVMKSMLKKSRNHGCRRIISVRGVPHNAVRVFIRFLYSSCYEEEEMDEYVLPLLVLSHVFMVPSLKRVCEQQLETRLLTEENVVDVFQISLLCDAARLGLFCHRMMLKNFKFVSDTEGWRAMKTSHPMLEKELVESVMEIDSRKQERLRKIEERKIYLQLYEAMEALVHICRDGCRTIGPHDKVLKGDKAPCNFATCKGLELLVRHFAGCKLRVPGGCIHCKRMWQLLELHSRLCSEPNECKVPLCRNFKARMQQQNKKDEMRWKILVKKIVRAKNIARAPLFSAAIASGAEV
ncbi:hypothetical protein IFM89_016688, partial [Coptis chinensis]